MKIVQLSGTTDALGALTMTASEAVTGFIEKIIMDYDDGDTGADVVFTAVEGPLSTPVMTKADLGTADAAFFPRTPGNKVADGAAFTNWADKIFVAGGKMKAVIASGGNAKNFKFLVVLSDES